MVLRQKDRREREVLERFFNIYETQWYYLQLDYMRFPLILQINSLFTWFIGISFLAPQANDSGIRSLHSYFRVPQTLWYSHQCRDYKVLVR